MDNLTKKLTLAEKPMTKLERDFKRFGRIWQGTYYKPTTGATRPTTDADKPEKDANKPTADPMTDAGEPTAIPTTDAHKPMADADKPMADAAPTTEPAELGNPQGETDDAEV